MLTKASKIAIAAVGAVVVIGGASFGYVASQSHDKDKTTTATVTKTAKSSAKSDKKSTGMDLTAISKGDFSSVEGTWKSLDGKSTFTFNKNGLVSHVYNGSAATNDQEVYLTKENDSTPEARMINGYLSTTVGPKGGLPEDTISATNLDFVPKGVKHEGMTDTEDHLFSGQSIGDGSVFTKVVESKDEKAVNQLSTKKKQALVLLGIPNQFQTDYGSAVTVSDLLNKKTKAYVENDASAQTNEVGHYVDTTFKQIKIVPHTNMDIHDNKVTLEGVPSDVADHNRAESHGVYTIDGDTITYRTQGNRVEGDPDENLRRGQQIGTNSLSKLYKQYKGTTKLKEMMALLD
ncbi:DUF6287 domain-containing protein [Fructobacillus parabroussonetiae]|uniref:DUF6287 domain-containing protein n=1 Tax=Fructobacillus parabroussonetiae TaxID=2713174 RepID=A0ABS5QVV5_9LACO|nr:DUF6287 domain-containing protein [Fructobacillus parabroussonetiae]MBS9337343.1 hypothetical protein [Fructobacillus parabroussonetiae]